MNRIASTLFLLGTLCLLNSEALTAAEQAKTVTLEIAYGDGVEKHFTAAPYREGITVADLLLFAKKHARGIEYKTQGTGEIALLTELDDLKNEGRGKNWLYRINGELADRSFAVYKLKVGDVVRWEYGEYKP